MNRLVANFRNCTERLSKVEKICLIFWFIAAVGILFFEGFNFFDSNLNVVFLLLMCFSMYQIFSSEALKFDLPYHGDPYDFLQIKHGKLVLGRNTFPLEKINKIALNSAVQIGKQEYAYLSLPFNHVEGKALGFYFDQGFYLSMHNYLQKHISNVEFIK
jgi:hypothetical protein